MRDVIRPLVSSLSNAVYIAPGATLRPARVRQFLADGHAVGVVAEPQNRQ